MYKVPAILPDCEKRAIQGAVVSLGTRNIPLIGLSCEKKCLAFNSKFIKQKFISPSIANTAELIDFYLGFIPRGVLFPSNDKSIIFLSENSNILELEGFSFNIPSKASIENGFNKWKCYNLSRKLDIPCAFTMEIKSEHDIDKIKTKMPYPFIIKATTLAGGNYIKVSCPEEIHSAYNKMTALITSPDNRLLKPRLIAQEWLYYNMDDIWCVESYYSKNGTPVGFYPIKKTRTVMYRDGTYGSRLYAGEFVYNEKIIYLTRRILDHLQWKGFAHLDWIYCKKTDQFYLTEINPRLPGFSYLPYKAGFDMAYYYYADMIGEEIDKLASARPVVYFEALRYPGDISSSISLIFRRQYDWKKFILSYIKSCVSKKKVVIDLLYIEDLKLTYLNLCEIYKTVLIELIIFLRSKIFRF